MSAAPHSPAPWKFRGDGLRDARDRVILLTVPASGLTVAQDDANRRLIESVPELVAMLREAVDAMTAHGIAGSHYNIEHMVELLAKLEGTA